MAKRGKPKNKSVSQVLKEASESSFARFQNMANQVQQYVASGKSKGKTSKEKRFSKSTLLAAGRERKRESKKEAKRQMEQGKKDAKALGLGKGTLVPPAKPEGFQGGSNQMDGVSPPLPREPIAAPSPGKRPLDRPMSVSVTDSMQVLNRG